MSGPLRPPVDLRPRDLPFGTVLRRVWKGRLVEVTIIRPPRTQGKYTAAAVVKNGWWRFQWEGRRVRTLSEVTYAVTGDRYLSGSRFFGLRARRRRVR